MVTAQLQEDSLPHPAPHELGEEVLPTIRYKSEALVAIHESMTGLYKVGAVDEQTMRELDETSLKQIKSRKKP